MQTLINIKGNVIEANAKKEHLETIATLDVESLKKLAELAKNPKAPKILKDKWVLIKTFL